jgi:hypothetical protein
VRRTRAVRARRAREAVCAPAPSGQRAGNLVLMVGLLKVDRGLRYHENSHVGAQTVRRGGVAGR